MPLIVFSGAGLIESLGTIYLEYDRYCTMIITETLSRSCVESHSVERQSFSNVKLVAHQGQCHGYVVGVGPAVYKSLILQGSFILGHVSLGHVVQVGILVMMFFYDERFIVLIRV